MSFIIRPTDPDLRGEFAKYPSQKFTTSDEAWDYIEENADAHADSGFTEFEVLETKLHNGRPTFTAFCENDGEVIVENEVTGQRLALTENALEAILNYAIEEKLVREV
jgi:hypothetical protein